jgi:hypothetical protein
MSRALPKRPKPERRPPVKRGSSAPIDGRIAKLTPLREELLDFADSHPIPEAFWHGEDDPSQPASLL